MPGLATCHLELCLFASVLLLSSAVIVPRNVLVDGTTGKTGGNLGAKPLKAYLPGAQDDGVVGKAKDSLGDEPFISVKAYLRDAQYDGTTGKAKGTLGEKRFIPLKAYLPGVQDDVVTKKAKGPLTAKRFIPVKAYLPDAQDAAGLAEKGKTSIESVPSLKDSPVKAAPVTVTLPATQDGADFAKRAKTSSESVPSMKGSPVKVVSIREVTMLEPLRNLTARMGIRHHLVSESKMHDLEDILPSESTAMRVASNPGKSGDENSTKSDSAVSLAEQERRGYKSDSATIATGFKRSDHGNSTKSDSGVTLAEQERRGYKSNSVRVAAGSKKSSSEKSTKSDSEESLAKQERRGYRSNSARVAAGLKSEMHKSVSDGGNSTGKESTTPASISSLFEVGAWEKNVESAFLWDIRAICGSAFRYILGGLWPKVQPTSEASPKAPVDKVRISDGHEITARLHQAGGVAVPVELSREKMTALDLTHPSLPVVHVAAAAGADPSQSNGYTQDPQAAQAAQTAQAAQAAQAPQYSQGVQPPNPAQPGMEISGQPVQQPQATAPPVPPQQSQPIPPPVPSTQSNPVQNDGLVVQPGVAPVPQQSPGAPALEVSGSPTRDEVEETEKGDEDSSSAAESEETTEVSETAQAATPVLPSPAGGAPPAGEVAASLSSPGSPTSTIRGDNITQLSNMVYKVAKEEKVHRLAVAPCRTSLKWMPDVVRKLEYEIPGFKFYCVDTWEKGSPESGGQELGSLTLADISAAFADCASTEVLSMPISKTESLFPRDIDLVVSWMGMQAWGTRKAWRFIKGLRRSGTRLGLFGNDPRAKNAESDEKRRLNVRKSPMLFNEPLRVISRVGEDEEENPKQLLLYPMDGIRDGF